MPVPLSRGDRRLLLACGAVLAVLVALGAFLGPGKGAEHPTTFSAASGGAKALYLLLQESGYDVARWQQPVQELPDGTNTTLVLADPVEAPSARDRAALRRFLESGGHVLATSDIGASYLSATVKRDPVEGLTWKQVRASSPSPITRAAPSITLAPLYSWSPVEFGVPLYADDDVYVVLIPAGAGRAIWVGSATPLTNAGIREPGNLEFVLATLGPPGGRRVLFDEYSHGHRRTLIASMWRSPAKWALFQFVVLALVLVATHARRSGPILVPAVESRLSPLEFVRTLGSLYARAGAAAVAVDMAAQRFRYLLARRLGISPNASVADIERGLAARAPAEAGSVAATLRTCDAARDTRRLDARTALKLVNTLSELRKKLRLDST